MISQAQFDAEMAYIIQRAIQEDVGDGDHSTLACIPPNHKGGAKLLIKDQGVIAGVSFAQQVFAHIDPEISIDVRIADGASVSYGDIAFYVEGNVHSILRAERLVLNGMQRMSAIASKTAYFVKLLAGTSTRVLDTRKTTPGIRALEKWAVKIGGGENHRFGLYDMIMLKDNHIDFTGGISEAISSTKTYLKTHDKSLKIIVEARDLREVESILMHEGIHRILLDNFDYATTRKAVALIDKRCLTESSGDINETNIRNYADCGVDYVSSGALTHSVHNMNLSLKAI